MFRIHKIEAFVLIVIFVIVLLVIGFAGYQYLVIGPTPVNINSKNNETVNEQMAVQSEPEFLARANLKSGIREEWLVPDPATADKLLVTLNFPATAGQFPLIFLIPGELESGQIFNDAELVAQLVSHGYAVAYFAPAAPEDYNGYLAQAELHAVLLYLASRADIAADQIGVVSYGEGVTLASGALARYLGDPQVQFLLDWEGPMNRDQTTGGCAVATSKIDWPACTAEDFWWQREAFRFLEQLNLPYLRIQGATDHFLPQNEHAILALNSIAKSASPWYRINDAEVNTVYSLADPPQWIDKNSKAKVEDYILELAIKFFNARD